MLRIIIYCYLSHGSISHIIHGNFTSNHIQLQSQCGYIGTYDIHNESNRLVRHRRRFQFIHSNDRIKSHLASVFAVRFAFSLIKSFEKKKRNGFLVCSETTDTIIISRILKQNSIAVYFVRCGTMRKTVTNIGAIKVYVFIFLSLPMSVWSQSLVESSRGACPESVCNVGDLLVMRFVMKIGMFNINNNKNPRSGWKRRGAGWVKGK